MKNPEFVHETHPKIIKRLKRANGHLNSIIAMIETNRPCLDIAQQLHAVEKAIAQAKRVLIHDHLDHCLEDTVGPLPRAARASVDEFRQIAKYL
ncbi:MAG: metal-sensing transcriptional repressor [Mesorhizobium sp.]|nr:metal-sensing transcriptional repressor [Mesorhizobium sp.]MBL8579860.1 metal-sensing transcriptional repressor [Mesorhizobium sp.]